MREAAPRARPRRGRRLLLSLVAAGVSAALFVLVYELMARARDRAWREDYDAEGLLQRVTVAADDPVLLWRYRANARHDWLRTNEHGFRERPTPLPKPEGEHRVAFVGDSVVLGWGVPVEQTFVRALEADPPRDWPASTRTLNFGVDGYHSLQIARLLETRVLDFEPDHVVHVLCLNDFDFEDASARKIDYFDPPRSFLWRRLQRAYQNRRSPHADYHQRHFHRHRDEVFDALRRMHQLSTEAGATFELWVLPVFPEAPDFDSYSLEPLHEALADHARQHGIPHRDFLEPLRASGQPPRALAQDLWHLTPAGHRLVSELARTDSR